MSAEQQAVIDRIVNGQAVLIIDNREERIVPAAQLPAGATEGTWLRVSFDETRLISAVVDAEATEQARVRIEEKVRRLRERGRN